MGKNGPNRKVANSLVALSSAAILAVYAAGYVRTRSAADRFAEEAIGRRTAVPAPQAGTEAIGSAAAVEPDTRIVAPSPAAAPASPKPRSVDVVPPRPAAASEPLVSPPPDEPIADITPVPDAPAAQTVPTGGEPALLAEPATPPPAEQSTAETPTEPSAVAKVQYRDGTYLGWGSCRHGDIQATVVIEAGRIVSARISQCQTRYPCSWIDNLPPEVANRQGPPVNYVSGATESSDAFWYAVVEALSKAK